MFYNCFPFYLCHPEFGPLGAGLVLGLGTTIGGQLGVKLTVLKGHKWIRGVVTIAVLVFALKLWLQS